MRLWHPAELGATPSDVGNSSAALYVRNWSTKDHAHIGNLETEMLLLDTGTHQFPVSVNRNAGREGLVSQIEADRREAGHILPFHLPVEGNVLGHLQAGVAG